MIHVSVAHPFLLLSCVSLCLFVHILVTLGCRFGDIMDKAAVDSGVSPNLWVSSVLAASRAPLVSQQLRAVVWHVLSLSPAG